jgi:flagellar biosynthetic protein FliR
VPANVTLSLTTLYSFMLVLARVSGALVFVPIPGITAAPEAARAGFSLAVTLALYSRWPLIQPTQASVANLAGWAFSEAAVGLAIGISVAIVLETFSFAAQVLGLQAGYGYASTIDPNTQADSGILLVFAQLISGMMFFALGLDRDVLRLFALSLERVPAGVYLLGRASAQPLIHLIATLFSVGVRLALPVVALLVMVDVALALLGRINSQLQLISLAFPAKMLTTLILLCWLAPLYPRIMREISGQAWQAVYRTLGL